MKDTKALFRGPSKKLGTELMYLERKQLRLLVGIIIGHWLAVKHLERLGIRNETQCPRCEEEERPLFTL